MVSTDITNLHTEIRLAYSQLNDLHTNTSLLGDVNNYYERDLRIVRRLKDLVINYSIDKVTDGNSRTVLTSTGSISSVMEECSLTNYEMVEVLMCLNTLLNKNMFYNFELN